MVNIRVETDTQIYFNLFFLNITRVWVHRVLPEDRKLEWSLDYPSFIVWLLRDCSWLIDYKVLKHYMVAVSVWIESRLEEQ